MPPIDGPNPTKDKATLSRMGRANELSRYQSEFIRELIQVVERLVDAIDSLEDRVEQLEDPTEPE